MKLTDSLKPVAAEKGWFVVDATDLPLGRLSTEISRRLKGKHKPNFTSHVDNGDNIIVINAEKVRLTGRKLVNMDFFWHTGHPGGIKSEAAETTLGGKHPERLIERSVRRMMPKTKLGRSQLGKLHVYAGTEHPHSAQKPEALDVNKLISKKKYSMKPGSNA